LYGVLFFSRPPENIGVVVDHASKKSFAVSRVFFGIQNVLMPELVKVITPTGVQPRYQHESRFGLKKS